MSVVSSLRVSKAFLRRKICDVSCVIKHVSALYYLGSRPVMSAPLQLDALMEDRLLMGSQVVCYALEGQKALEIEFGLVRSESLNLAVEVDQKLVDQVGRE